MVHVGGIVACFLTSLFGLYIYKVDTKKKIQKALNIQLLISALLTIGAQAGIVFILPAHWAHTEGKHGTRWRAFGCIVLGIGGGYLIGSITDFYTAGNFKPVKDMAKACTSGSAINIIYGLALGYNSTFVPIAFIAIIIVVNMSLLSFLGISFGAIGILSTLCIELSIDAYGPICDNAGGISEMS